MSHSPQAKRFEQKRQPVEYEEDLLWQCIRQVEQNQIVAHFEAGDLNQGESDGRDTED